jgi:signal transduction histidine kinase
MRKKLSKKSSPFYTLHIGLGITLIISLIMGWNIYWENVKSVQSIERRIVAWEQEPGSALKSTKLNTLTQEKQEGQVDIALTLIVTLMIIILLVITWIYILKTLYAWQKEITTKNQQLTHINQHLDELVHQRTEHLHAAYKEKQQLAMALQQNQKLQAIGRLAAGVAHDFNNYLGIILAHSEFLQTRLNNQTEQRPNQTIIETTHKASELIKQLLTFARRSQHHKENVDINTIILEALKLIKINLAENIQIITTLAENLQTVNADKNQVLQVLLNVLLNAIDAMPNGGTITITTENYHLQADGKNYSKITITDTGIGMTQEELEQIFEPFYSTKEVGKGTGLGLAMAFSIMQQHNGTILVDSTKNQGSCFSILFPL